MIACMDNIIKSLYFDLRIMFMKSLPISTRCYLLFSKLLALTRVLFIGNGTFSVGNSRIKVKSIGDVGTIQSSIVDFYDDIIRSNIINTTRPKIIDVGANIGQFSTAVKLFYPEAQIIAFEPDPEIYALYRKNLINQKRIVIHNYGLGAASARKTFYRNNLSGTSSFVKGKAEDLRDQIDLNIRTLDSFKIKGVDLLKIDVEGFEYEVISGGSRTLKSAKYTLIEVSLKRITKISNISVLSSISAISKEASILKFGRALGDKSSPTCQDVLIKL